MWPHWGRGGSYLTVVVQLAYSKAPANRAGVIRLKNPVIVYPVIITTICHSLSHDLSDLKQKKMFEIKDLIPK